MDSSQYNKPKLENIIAWWNEVAAGVGLILGYLLFAFYVLFTPEHTITLTKQRVDLEQKVIGYIPEDITTTMTLEQAHAQPRVIPVIEWVPQIENGIPVIINYEAQISGIGTPVYEQDFQEVLIPMPGQPNLDIEVKHFDDLEVVRYLYSLNIIHKGTGYYLKNQNVTFEGLTADIFALRVGTLFAGLAILLFLMKSWKRIMRFIKYVIWAPVDSALGDSDYDVD